MSDAINLPETSTNSTEATSERVHELLKQFEQLNKTISERKAISEKRAGDLFVYENIRWLQNRQTSKLYQSYEGTPEPTRSQTPYLRINLTEFVNKIGPSFVFNFGDDAKRDIAGYDVKRLFRLAMRSLHPDSATIVHEDAADRIRLAKALRDAGDGEGLALLCLHSGVSLDVDYASILEQRIAASNKYLEALTHTVGHLINQRMMVGSSLYDAGLFAYVKALEVMGDSPVRRLYCDRYGVMPEYDTGEVSAKKHWKPFDPDAEIT